MRRTAPLEPMLASHERQIVVEAGITIVGAAPMGVEARSENVGLVNRTPQNAQIQSRALRRSRLPYTRAASSHFFERSETDLSVLSRLGQTFPPHYFLRLRYNNCHLRCRVKKTSPCRPSSPSPRSSAQSHRTMVVATPQRSDPGKMPDPIANAVVGQI